MDEETSSIRFFTSGLQGSLNLTDEYMEVQQFRELLQCYATLRKIFGGPSSANAAIFIFSSGSGGYLAFTRLNERVLGFLEAGAGTLRLSLSALCSPFFIVASSWLALTPSVVGSARVT